MAYRDYLEQMTYVHISIAVQTLSTHVQVLMYSCNYWDELCATNAAILCKTFFHCSRIKQYRRGVPIMFGRTAGVEQPAAGWSQVLRHQGSPLPVGWIIPEGHM